MKTSKIILVLIALTTGSSLTYGQLFRKVNNESFTWGENLVYKVYYHTMILGKLTVGEATLNISPEEKKYANRDSYYVKGRGVCKGLLNVFYKVDDRYETVIDAEAIIPWKFVRRVDEDGYKITQDVWFNHIDNIAKSNKADTKVPADVQDILSAFYFARTIDFSNIKIGDEYNIKFYLDDSVFTTKIIFAGREEIRTGMGKFNCLKFKPKVLVGKVFKEQYPLTLWITDDKNRIPLKVEAGILVGSVAMELKSYSGLKNPLSSKINEDS